MSQMVRYVMAVDTWSCPLYSGTDADEESDLSTISSVSPPNGFDCNKPETVTLALPKDGQKLKPGCAC
jgi:hypothetical protein